MRPENPDGSDGKNHSKEKELRKQEVLIFYPLALSSLIVFDLRTSLESQPAARLFTKNEILPPELIEKIANHSMAIDKSTADKSTVKEIVQGIGLAVVKKLAETRPEIANETNISYHFFRGPMVFFYREQSWKRVASIIFDKIDEDTVVDVFKKLEQEERNNQLRDLVTGNRHAGWGSIWQRGQNNRKLARLLWFFN